jgi:hypothetical protein
MKTFFFLNKNTTKFVVGILSKGSNFSKNYLYFSQLPSKQKHFTTGLFKISMTKNNKNDGQIPSVCQKTDGIEYKPHSLFLHFYLFIYFFSF